MSESSSEALAKSAEIGRHQEGRLEIPDVLCGGFPCQPVSVAGSRRGDRDDRWLWPEFLRAIREIRPRYALVENVPGLFSINDGRLARRVFGDLAEAGYDSEWDCISAQDVGAPHLRRRVFIIAYPHESRRRKEPVVFTECLHPSFVGYDSSERIVENSRFMARSERTEIEGIVSGFAEEGNSCSKSAGPSDSQLPNPECERLLSEYFPQTRQTARYSGFEQQWAVEPEVGRVADGVPSRVDRLRALGNAVVPQVAEWIGRQIMTFQQHQLLRTEEIVIPSGVKGDIPKRKGDRP